MNSNQLPDPSGENLRKWLEPGHDNAMLIYVLFFVSLAVGITAVIGVVMAYLNKGNSAADYVELHYTWLIRTFWIGLLFGAISAVLMIVGIGFLLIIATLVWAVVRLVVGLQALSRHEPVRDPSSWWI